MLVIPQDMVEISLSYFAERQLGLPGFTGSILQKVQQEIDVKAWKLLRSNLHNWWMD